ncbi:MAG: hypothetical protein NC118_03455 [Eubacterium sp.]|nr:hypothetical protein [Eubacterium sp.]
MGVIMGAMGKSPSIDKHNRLLQEEYKQSSGEYLESQIALTQEKIRERYPKTGIDWSFIRKGKDEDGTV